MTEPWFDEIDLDPGSPWLRMATRQLGARPWLVLDDRRADELGLKRRLLAERHDEVFAVQPGVESVGAAVKELILTDLEEQGATIGDGAAHVVHPLDQAGRLVQEDLCVLRRDVDGWVLAGASLCFPSRWRLADKLGRSLADVHDPVDGYREVLAGRVDQMLDRLSRRVVWRRNWFIHPNGALFQPERPVSDPVVAAERCGTGLFCRSERQTLRRLDGFDGRWALFTIRIQQTQLGTFLAGGDRRQRFARFLVEADPAVIRHRGISRHQALELEMAQTRGWLELRR